MAFPEADYVTGPVTPDGKRTIVIELQVPTDQNISRALEQCDPRRCVLRRVALTREDNSRGRTACSGIGKEDGAAAVFELTPGAWNDSQVRGIAPRGAKCGLVGEHLLNAVTAANRRTSRD